MNGIAALFSADLIAICTPSHIVCLYSVILLVRPNAARPNRTQSLERAEGFDLLLYLLCLLNVLCLLVFKPAPQSSAPHKTPPHRPKTRPPPQDDVRSKSLPP